MKVLLARFDSPDRLTAALERLHDLGYRRLEAFTPFPLPRVIELLKPPRTRIGWAAVLGALAGGLLTYAMIYWSAVVNYPLNIGGRPLHSWPAFLPAALVAAALWSGMVTLIAMLRWCGLPRWHHPLFSVREFDRATYDRYFLLLDCADPLFDGEPTRRLIEGFSPERIEEAER